MTRLKATLAFLGEMFEPMLIMPTVIIVGGLLDAKSWAGMALTVAAAGVWRVAYEIREHKPTITVYLKAKDEDE